MKRKILAAIVGLITIALCGCGFQFELPSPESLIMAPKYNQGKNDQKQIITSLLSSDESLTVPTSMENAMAYTAVDVDADSKDELVVFFRNTEKNFEQGFMILKQDDDEQWRIAHKVSEIGGGIDFFEITDLNLDDNLEILFGLKSGDVKTLYCYQLIGDQLKDLGRIQYESLLIVEKEGKPKQLITAINDISDMNGGSQITIYALEDDIFVGLYEEIFDGYCKSLVYGEIGHGVYGIGLAMLHSQFSSIILLAEDEYGYYLAMEEPLAFDYNAAQDMDIFSDINNDGILEICYLLPPSDHDGRHEVNEYLKVWYQWQKDAELLLIQAVLNNPSAGYDFILPLEWLEHIHYSFHLEGGIEWIDFYLENDDFSVSELFSIATMNQYSWQQNESLKEENVIVLGNNPTSNKVYLAKISNNLPTNMEITASQLISCLRIDGGK